MPSLPTALRRDRGPERIANAFDPFGAQIDPADPTSAAVPSLDSVPFGFTGHEHDWDLNLINMKGRLYDPQIGRFLSPDPLGEVAATAVGLNRCAYVLNNPGTLRDPSGFDPDWGGGTGGGGLPPPGPIPGGPTGGTPNPTPQPSTGQPPARGGLSPPPWNAVDADNRRIAASNAASQFTSVGVAPTADPGRKHPFQMVVQLSPNVRIPDEDDLGPYLSIGNGRLREVHAGSERCSCWRPRNRG